MRLKIDLNALMLLAIPLTIYLIFVIFPILWNIVISFTNMTVGGSYTFTGLENYIRLLNSTRFLNALKNTLMWFIIYLVFPIGLGLLMAILVNSINRGANFFKLVYFYPLSLSFAVIGIIWSFIYEPTYGVLNEILRKIGLGFLAYPWLIDPNIALIAVGIAASWRELGFDFVVFFAGLRAIPQEYLDAAKVDGASAFVKYRYIILPLLKPAFITAFAITMIRALKVFDIIYVMTRGGPGFTTEVLGYYAFVLAFEAFDYGGGAALSVILTLISLLFIALYLKIALKEEVRY
ncbi:MAG: sugar ABC transporter permease [Thermoprotei archaeon]|nr:MAG: sugar ABC transporter permease [Thermoprotei archaeon]